MVISLGIHNTVILLFVFQSAMAINLNITFQIIDREDGGYANLGRYDLRDPKVREFLFIAFGNGLIDEARVTSETKAGMLLFARMLEQGGYRRGKFLTVKNSRLYQSGDFCYPKEASFIFLSPLAENGEVVDYDHFDEETAALIESMEAEKRNEAG